MVRRNQRKNPQMPSCNHMLDEHRVVLTTVEALSLISAATHAVRGGYDDAPEQLQDAVNALLNQCNIDCKFKKNGTMILTYNHEGGA